MDCRVLSSNRLEEDIKFLQFQSRARVRRNERSGWRSNCQLFSGSSLLPLMCYATRLFYGTGSCISFATNLQIRVLVSTLGTCAQVSPCSRSHGIWSKNSCLDQGVGAAQLQDTFSVTFCLCQFGLKQSNLSSQPHLSFRRSICSHQMASNICTSCLILEQP